MFSDYFVESAGWSAGLLPKLFEPVFPKRPEEPPLENPVEKAGVLASVGGYVYCPRLGVANP